MLFKNQTPPESPFHDRVTHTLGLLRVLESVRRAEGDGPIGRLYQVYGTHIHLQKDLVDAATALGEAGLSTAHAAAYDDESWDGGIKASMEEGLSLTGKDVGTPILGFTNAKGTRVGFFGPVISRRLPLDDGLRLWDALMLMGGVDHFWELKRTRTETPDFTPVE